MKTIMTLIALAITGIPISAQDLSSKVRTLTLSQTEPVTVNVSTQDVTTIEFPANVSYLDSDQFTKKPKEEPADFKIDNDKNWVSLRSLRPGARHKLGVVIGNKIYAIWIVTSEDYDFSVILKFEEQQPERRRIPLAKE